MDDKELIVYLSKKVAELEKELDLAEKESCTSLTDIRSWKMSRNNDSGLFRAEWEYLNPPDNEEPETDKSPEYEALEWLKEVYYAYQEYR